MPGCNDPRVARELARYLAIVKRWPEDVVTPSAPVQALLDSLLLETEVARAMMSEGVLCAFEGMRRQVLIAYRQAHRRADRDRERCGCTYRCFAYRF